MKGKVMLERLETGRKVTWDDKGLGKGHGYAEVLLVVKTNGDVLDSFTSMGQGISKAGGQLELNLCSSHKGQEKPSSEAPSHGSLWA